MAVRKTANPFARHAKNTEFDSRTANLQGVDQIGRSLPWGGRGRTFNSCHPDCN